jgi:hypothetical protein
MRCYKPLPDSPERCAAMHDLGRDRPEEGPQRPCSARSTTRSTFHPVLPASTLTADPS